MSSEECQDWCTRRNEYMNDCQYITYFGKEGLPVKNACYIFASCEKKSVCANCVTETSDCLCSSNNISKIENTNLLQNITVIDTERDCRQKCRNYPSCEFYTYLNDSLECYLLSHLIEPFTICDGCEQEKQIALNHQQHQQHQSQHPLKQHQVEIHPSQQPLKLLQLHL